MDAQHCKLDRAFWTSDKICCEQFKFTLIKLFVYITKDCNKQNCVSIKAKVIANNIRFLISFYYLTFDCNADTPTLIIFSNIQLFNILKKLMRMSLICTIPQ